MLQNATGVNISDEHVSCTAHATRNASLQILLKCHTPSIVCGNATKPLRFAHFWQGAESLALRRKTTLQHPKVAQTCGVFSILTSKRASRHNSVHFLNISTSKRALDVVCFLHFDLEMCFAPQRRTLFRHRNFQKCPSPSVFNTFDLEMCFAPQRRKLFRHRNFQKCSECEAFFSFFTCKCVWRHNGVQFVISHLPRWLQARRFSEPTFRPSGATNHSWRFKTLEKSLSSRCLPAFPCKLRTWRQTPETPKTPCFWKAIRCPGCFLRSEGWVEQSEVANENVGNYQLAKIPQISAKLLQISANPKMTES